MRPTVTELEDLFWRTVWTAIPAFTSALIVSNVTDVNQLHAAAMAALTSVITSVTVYARQKAGTINRSQQKVDAKQYPQPSTNQ